MEVALDTLVEAENRLRSATIVAPFDGIVITMANMESGRRVRENETVLQVVDTSAMQVVALVSGEEAGRLNEGLEVRITVAALSNKTLVGRVDTVSLVLVDEVGAASYEVIISGGVSKFFRPGKYFLQTTTFFSFC